MGGRAGVVNGLYDSEAPAAAQRRAFRAGRVPVAVYGLGKLGLPIAAAFADACGNVVGADVDPAVVESVNRGECHGVREPDSPDEPRSHGLLTVRADGPYLLSFGRGFEDRTSAHLVVERRTSGMKRRTLLAALGAGGLSSLAGCAAITGARDEADHDVGMTASRFHPETLTVPVGTTVVWGNTSSRAHTITAYEAHIPENAAYFASGGFDAELAARKGWGRGEGGITTGETYEHTFEVPGEYHYFCIPHARGGMVGTVVVEE